MRVPSLFVEPPTAIAPDAAVSTITQVLTGRVGLSPVMVGRSASLERLRNVLDVAEVRTSDLPAIALVAGEAGIGKTRLLREMLASLPADTAVFSAMAEPGSLARPHDVARQLIPEQADGWTDRPGDAALEAVGRAARAGRTALVIEDLHWIDADSVAVLDAIARQPWPNLVIFATYRPSDLRRGAPGGDLVLRLERRNDVEQFRLDRLDRNEVGAMMTAIAGSTVSSAAVEAVYRRSGGVPYVVEELLRCAGPDACSDDIVSAQLPWSLEEAVRQQLTDLSAPERVVVDALGVFGEPAGFELLAELTGHDEAELLRHLRGLVERGVVEESRDDRFWFGHALLADAVPHQLLGRERRRLHERCFELLLRHAPDNHAALAFHASGAGRYDEIVAIARTGSRISLDHGASFQALRLACEGLAEDCTDPDLLAVATEAAWRLDFLPEAIEHALAWERSAPTVASRIDATRFLARLHLELDQHDESGLVVDRLIDMAETLPEQADRARAEAAVAQLMMLRHDPSTVAWADRAIARATEAGDRHVVVQALVERASAALPTVTREQAYLALREAAAAARELGDGVLLSRALNNTMDLVPPNSADWRESLRELRTVASRNGLDKLGTLNILWLEAIAAYADGNMAGHRVRLEEWAGGASTPKSRRDRAVDLAQLAVEEGRLVDAHSLLDAGFGSDARAHSASAGLVRLSLAALEHDTAAGRSWFEALVQERRLPHSWSATMVVAESTAAALTAGIPAAEIRERFVGGLVDGGWLSTQLVELVEGLLALAEGRHRDAVATLEQVLGEARTTLTRPTEGSLHLAHARALLAMGEREGATAAARRSVDALCNWPGWRRDRADAMVARLEGSSARAVGELTARESEVAALIAEGLTNGQLAERLFISPKTAAVHVSNILAKLVLTGRAEIAAWAVRQELPIAG